jgi:hypothetical protein
MSTNPSARPSLTDLAPKGDAPRRVCESVLDIATLAAVRNEVEDRQRDWHSAWRLHHLSAEARAAHDPRMVRVDELASLGRWLQERIDEADFAVTTVTLTPAGRRLAEEVSA